MNECVNAIVGVKSVNGTMWHFGLRHNMFQPLVEAHKVRQRNERKERPEKGSG